MAVMFLTATPVKAAPVAGFTSYCADALTSAHKDEKEEKAADEKAAKKAAAQKEQRQQDIDLLAHAIWNETGILGDTAMYYTGSVILNRIASDIYPDDLYSVIYQPGQYAITWTGMINRPAPERAYEIAGELLENGSILPSGYLFQAEFCQCENHNHIVIGNTYFCRRLHE